MERTNEKIQYGKFLELINEFFRQGSVFPVRFNNYVIFPGFCDVHVHFREPGFFYKETIESGSLAAARGGYTAVCAMPNLSPAPDGLETLKAETDIIEKDAVINVYPYGTITKGEKGEELSDMEQLAPFVCAFSDDGRGVQSEEMMRRAMLKAKSLGKVIAAHCEDDSLLFGGVMHEGEAAKRLGVKGISSESEYKMIERDLRLAKETGVKYHVCHISTAESVEIIRKAKKEGVNVTCETAPHYLVLTDEDVINDGRFKMNPPLRSESDRQALISGVLDGTIDMISTDHAPHTAEEKSKGLVGSPFGVVGIETAFAVMYSAFVKTKLIDEKRLYELLGGNARKRFSLPIRKDDFCICETETGYRINPENFLSKGKSTPLTGLEVYGNCVFTVCGGKIVWQKISTLN